MPARLAYPLIYAETTERLSEEGKLLFDEYLGSVDAAERREQRRAADVAASGFEVG